MRERPSLPDRPDRGAQLDQLERLVMSELAQPRRRPVAQVRRRGRDVCHEVSVQRPDRLELDGRRPALRSGGRRRASAGSSGHRVARRNDGRLAVRGGRDWATGPGVFDMKAGLVQGLDARGSPASRGWISWSPATKRSAPPLEGADRTSGRSMPAPLSCWSPARTARPRRRARASRCTGCACTAGPVMRVSSRRPGSMPWVELATQVTEIIGLQSTRDGDDRDADGGDGRNHHQHRARDRRAGSRRPGMECGRAGAGGSGIAIFWPRDFRAPDWNFSAE